MCEICFKVICGLDIVSLALSQWLKKLGVHYVFLSFCMFQTFHLTKSSVPCPRPQSKPSNQIRLIATLESSPDRAQRGALDSFHPGTCALPKHTCARTVPCRPGMPCCCSHSCRVRLALQWLGVGQHSPTTNPATWIPEDSNHC